MCKGDVRREGPERGIAGIVNGIVLSHGREGRFSHVGPEPMPARSVTVGILDKVVRLLYPGYFSPAGL